MSNFDHVWGPNQRGGPAFPSTSTPHPQNVDAGPTSHPGLSIWQYYAAHTPAIPNWFMPEGASEEDEAPSIPSTHGLNEFHKRQLAMVLADQLDRNDADLQVRSFLHKFDEAKDGKDTVKRRTLERRFFAWRKYYADMMVSLGSEKP